MPRILPGLDVLLATSQNHHFHGQKLGLLTNQIGLTRENQPILPALREADFTILALFTPEHGFEGRLEGAVADSALPDGTPIHSLYGAIQRPTSAMLAPLDAMICDLQDVGARFYTNATTIYEILEACALAQKPVIILDRPNPLGGLSVEGPLLDDGLHSFIGAAPIPVTHGLTLGELALFYRSWKGLNVEIEIIRAQGWQRDLLWPDCDLQWRQPSPNLPDFHSAAWYPGLALMEFCALSVGRGTDAPFRILGSPDFRVAEFLAAFESEEISAQPTEFIPTRATFENQKCVGVRFDCASEFPKNPVEFGLRAMHATRIAHPDFPRDNWNRAGKLVGSQSVLDALLHGDLSFALEKSRADAAAFRESRAEFLIY